LITETPARAKRAVTPPIGTAAYRFQVMPPTAHEAVDSERFCGVSCATAAPIDGSA
jgi:hypothetical protein